MLRCLPGIPFYTLCDSNNIARVMSLRGLRYSTDKPLVFHMMEHSPAPRVGATRLTGLAAPSIMGN